VVERKFVSRGRPPSCIAAVRSNQKTISVQVIVWCSNQINYLSKKKKKLIRNNIKPDTKNKTHKEIGKIWL